MASYVRKCPPYANSSLPLKQAVLYELSKKLKHFYNVMANCKIRICIHKFKAAEPYTKDELSINLNYHFHKHFVHMNMNITKFKHVCSNHLP